jgi:hypothetical protein
MKTAVDFIAGLVVISPEQALRQGIIVSTRAEIQRKTDLLMYLIRWFRKGKCVEADGTVTKAAAIICNVRNTSWSFAAYDTTVDAAAALWRRHVCTGPDDCFCKELDTYGQALLGGRGSMGVKGVVAGSVARWASWTWPWC